MDITEMDTNPVNKSNEGGNKVICDPCNKGVKHFHNPFTPLHEVPMRIVVDESWKPLKMEIAYKLPHFVGRDKHLGAVEL